MRLQLTRRPLLPTTRLPWFLASAFAAGVATAAPAARAEGNVTAKVGAETSVFQDSNATTVFTPTLAAGLESPTAGWGVNGRYLVDVVSAASPDIVSTASRRWMEVRHAGNLGLRYKPGSTGFAINGSTSYTPDYLSFSGSGTFTQDLDDKNLTLIASYGLGYDRIGKTGTPLSVFSRDFVYHMISAAVSRVVSSSTIFTVVGDLQLERGDQSKPYRFIPLFSPQDAGKIGAGASPDLVANLRLQEKPLEQLPLARERYALTGRLATRFSSSTLRLDERLYADSWSMKGTTTDGRYMIDLGERVTVWPHLRFHYQSPVDFWKLAYVSNGPTDIPKLRTGDRELGQLINVGTGLGFRWALGSAGDKNAWVLTATVDGVYTKFFEALYVTQRLSVLGVLNLEATF